MQQFLRTHTLPGYYTYCVRQQPATMATVLRHALIVRLSLMVEERAQYHDIQSYNMCTLYTLTTHLEIKVGTTDNRRRYHHAIIGQMHMTWHQINHAQLHT